MNPLADTLMCPSSGHSVGPEANLREAACLLLQHGHSCLFSVDHNGRLVGKVTEDDLLQALFAGASDRTPAASLAVPVATPVHCTDSAASARSLLYESLTDCLPVLDHSGKLTGIIKRPQPGRQISAREDFCTQQVSDWVPTTFCDDLTEWTTVPRRRPGRRRSQPQLRLFNPDEPRPIFICGAQALSLLRSADDSL